MKSDTYGCATASVCRCGTAGRASSSYEFMDDAPSTYESQPRRSLNPWLESHPLLAWERLDQT
jgi:hypothetical protein